jgi:hypothetical protein
VLIEVADLLIQPLDLLLGHNRRVYASSTYFAASTSAR